ncbi:MAG: hypothetical protein Q9190_006043 [Brigantiaea leucoxantha]
MYFQFMSLLYSASLAVGVHSQNHRPNNLVDCLTSVSVRISVPSSQDFNLLSQPYNLRLQYTPAVIVLPTTIQQISDSVRCASSSGTKVQARSGGHSYASYSLGGQNGTMVIDLSAFNDVYVHGGIARVDGGVRLGNLALGIYNQTSPRALPHGVCPGVGTGGHATHGGYFTHTYRLEGYSSRNWGLMMDTIVGLDVVLSNGSFVHAASSRLFEERQTVTKFYFQTQPAPSSIVNWVYTIPISSVNVAASSFLHIQNFARNASVVDSKIGLGVSPSASSFRISGVYYGDQEDFTSRIVPELLRGLPTPTSQSAQTLDWISSLTQLWGGPLQQPLTGYSAHDNFYAKSILLAALTSYFTYIATNGTHAPQPWFSEINLLGGPGSRINDPPIAASNAAYSERGALWVVQHYSEVYSSPPQQVFNFVNGLNSALENAMPGTTFGGYLNYVDPELSPDQSHRLYYSQEVYERLVRIKREVDPDNIFSNPQSVGM